MDPIRTAGKHPLASATGWLAVLTAVALIAWTGVAYAQFPKIPIGNPLGGLKPLDSNSKIRLDRAKEAVAGITIQEDLRKNVPVAKAAELYAEHERVRMAIDTADNELRMVKDRNHPEVVAFTKKLDGYRSYHKDLADGVKQHQEANKAAAGVRGKFFDDFWDDHATLANFYPLIDEPDLSLWYGEQKTLAEGKAALARIHAGCTGPYKEIANDPTNHPNDRTRRPDLMCRAAAMGDKLLKRRVIGVVKGVMAEAVDSWKAQIAAMGEDDGRLSKAKREYLWDPEAMRKNIQERFGADLAFVGVPLDDTVFGDANKVREALIAEIPKHLSRWKFGGHGTKTRDAFVEKSYKEAEKGLKIHEIQLRLLEWEVKLNALGTPIHRHKRGGVHFQIPGETWCHDDGFVYYQDYQGNGKFSQSYYEHGPRDLRNTRIVSCQ